MPATGRKKIHHRGHRDHRETRWVFLCVLCGALQAAELPVRPALLELSAALEDGNAARFLAMFDKKRCPDYGKLEGNVVALVAQYDVGSSVGIVDQAPEGDAVELKLDWLLRLRPSSGGPAVERRGQLRCRLEPRGKKWKVVSLEPVSFFSAIVTR